MRLEQFEQSRIPIVEIFNSISGEGISSGEIVTFIRVAGCNLRCSYCDTTYSYDETNEEIQWLTPYEILEKILSIGCNKIICTGGEPLEYAKMKRYLPLFLASKGLNVRIETNGSCSLYDEEEIQHYAGNIPIDLYYVLDIKSISSGMSDKNVFKENFSKMKSGDEIKFVVGNKEDIEYAFKVIEDYKAVISSKNVIINFSPIFHMIEPKEIVDVLKDRNQYFVEHNLNARLSLQIHKYIWPPEARGV